MMKFNSSTKKQSFTGDLQNVLQIKLQEAALCGFKQPIFGA